MTSDLHIVKVVDDQIVLFDDEFGRNVIEVAEHFQFVFRLFSGFGFLRRSRRESGIELRHVRIIESVSKVRHVRRLIGLLGHQIPFDEGEERVSLDGDRRRQPLVDVPPQEPPQQVRGLGAQKRRNGELAPEDSLLRLSLAAIRVEGRSAGEQVVHEDSVTPPIGRFAVTRGFDDHLRRHVLDRAAKGRGQLVASAEDLAEAEIDEFDVAVGVEHDVLGLEVAIDDVEAVEVL